MKLLGQNLTNGGKIKSIGGFPIMKFSLIQGAGAELEPMVKVGDKVKVGTVLAKPKPSMLGATLHSSVSGEVVEIVKEELDCNQSGNVIYVKNDESETCESPLKALDDINLKSLCERLDNCGVVDLDSSGFPLAGKLENFFGTSGEDKRLRYIFIDATSSDAYLTADVSVMIEQSDRLLRAVEILKTATKCESFVFVVRKGQKKLIQNLVSKIDEISYIYLVEVQSKLCAYDDGAILKAVLNDNLEDGEVLADKGCICVNIQTLCAVVDAVDYGLPCISRVITCSGGALKEPCNALVKIGSSYEFIIGAIGGEKYPLSEYVGLEEKAKNSYSNYLQLRDEFKDDATNESVRNRMIEVRKTSDSDIMEFLKAEKLYSNVVQDCIILGGGICGFIKKHHDFGVSKSSQGILLLTKSENAKIQKIRNKRAKKY